MNLLEQIKSRRSIRRYQDRQIPRKDLEKIIEAGTYASNAGGGQRSMIVGIRNAELVERVGRMNMAHFDRSRLIGSYVSKEQPYLKNVYPSDTRKLAGIVFEIKDGEREYFNLGVNPIFRECYCLGAGNITPKGYVISENCIGCGKCRNNCPQRCIEPGKPCRIQQNHCLHCGNCLAVCPAGAVEKRA